MKTTQANLDTAYAAFEQIIANCAPLKHELRETPEHEAIDLTLRFPEQPGLLFEVELNLVGVELHLNASAFWCEWFSTKNPKRVAAFIDAATGLLIGEHRLLETLRDQKPVRSKLQFRQDDGWVTDVAWSRIHLPFGKKSERIIQNTAFTHPSPSSN